MTDTETLIVDALAKLGDAQALIAKDKIREAGVAAGLAYNKLELAARIIAMISRGMRRDSMRNKLPSKDVNRIRVRAWTGGVDEHCTFRVVDGNSCPEKTGANTITVGRGWLFRNAIPPEDLD
jgi:hypothetical protein